MGCYDEVVFDCPVCKKTTCFKSKAGNCGMRTFGLGNAPLTIIANMNDNGERGNLFCEKCGAKLKCNVRFNGEIVSADDDREDDKWREV